MSQLNGDRIVNALYGLLSGLDATDRTYLRRIIGGEFKVRVQFGDAGATATSVGVIPFYTNDTGLSVRVTAAKLLAPVTIAPGATDNVAFVLSKVDSAGANATTVASYTSDVAGGTATADVPKALSVVGGTSTAAVLVNGGSLRIAATKGASGVPIAEATTTCTLEVTMGFDI